MTLTLVMLVLVDLWTLAPGHDYADSGSRVANAIGSLRVPRRRGDPADVRVECRIVWDGELGRARVGGLPPDARWSMAYDYEVRFRERFQGLWGLTERVMLADVVTHSFVQHYPAPPGEDVSRAGFDVLAWQALLARAQEQGLSPAWADAMAEASPTGRLSFECSRVLWRGWVRNAGTLLLWMLLAFSAWGHVSRYRDARRVLRRARGVCPWCRYDLRSLGPTCRCPECGSPPPRPVPHEGGPAWRAFWSRVRSPLGTGVLAAVLLMDLALLPSDPTGACSSCALWARSRMLGRAPTERRVEEGADKVRFVVLADPSRRDIMLRVLAQGEALPERPYGTEADAEGVPGVPVRLHNGTSVSSRDVLRTGTLYVQETRRGWWAPVRGFTWFRSSGFPANDSGLSGVDEIVRKGLIDGGQEVWARRLREHAWDRPVSAATLWGGHMHNAFAMAIGVLFLCSWAWLPARVARRGETLTSGFVSERPSTERRR